MDQNPSRPTSVTVADVARRAGVSKATAARVLGGYGTVSDRVREAVTAAARSLDYRPNELARSMTTGRSGTIGVVVGDIENPFFSLAVRGIADVARQAGFTVILINSGEDVAAEKAAIRTLLAKRVDGLIVSPAKEGELDHLQEVARSGRRWHCSTAAARHSTSIRYRRRQNAAEGVTRRLLALGHRRIAYLTACDTPDHLFRTPADINTGSVSGYRRISRCLPRGEPGRDGKVGACRRILAGHTRRIATDMLRRACVRRRS